MSLLVEPEGSVKNKIVIGYFSTISDYDGTDIIYLNGSTEGGLGEYSLTGATFFVDYPEIMDTEGSYFYGRNETEQQPIILYIGATYNSSNGLMLSIINKKTINIDTFVFKWDNPYQNDYSNDVTPLITLKTDSDSTFNLELGQFGDGESLPSYLIEEIKSKTNYNSGYYFEIQWSFDGIYSKVYRSPSFKFNDQLISNVCFIKDTLVHTDQGIIPIQDIKNQTIRSQKVILTTTVNKDPYLVKVNAYAFGDYPTKDTYMSMRHKMYHNGLNCAREYVNDDTVTLVPYQGELLYNVLLEKHGMMKVHNMLVETLDPMSDVAIFYRAKLSPKQKEHYKKLLNEQKDYEKTVQILKRYI